MKKIISIILIFVTAFILTALTSCKVNVENSGDTPPLASQDVPSSNIKSTNSTQEPALTPYITAPADWTVSDDGLYFTSDNRPSIAGRSKYEKAIVFLSADPNMIAANTSEEYAQISLDSIKTLPAYSEIDSVVIKTTAGGMDAAEYTLDGDRFVYVLKGAYAYRIRLSVGFKEDLPIFADDFQSMLDSFELK